MKQYQKEVIKAWLDGETVQYQLGSNWCDYKPEKFFEVYCMFGKQL